MIYGYIRVSTDKQTVENQRFEIENYCKERNLIVNAWIEETISGTKKVDERKLGKLLHKVHKGDKNVSFMVDEVMPFKICQEGAKIKNNPNVTYALHKAEIGRGNQIPLWMFGFLY